MRKQSVFFDKRVLITGGLGFVGSSLALRLLPLGARVTILDNLTPNQGGNEFNIETIKDEITINYADIRDQLAVEQLVKNQDYVFHLARQTDHILSLTDPYPDIDVNVRGTAILLEALKKFNRSAKLIYVGTRGQYGSQVTLPVNEDAPTNPRGIYEITNLTAEKMVSVYHQVHGVASIMLRLTNVYGPRSQMKHDHYGVVNWFIRLAMEGKTIPIYGDGALKRDFLYISDAIDAILAVSEHPGCYGEIINIGNNKAETFLELVKLLIKVAKNGSWEFTPFTADRSAQEPGHFLSDITKIQKLTGWKPTIDLENGLAETISFYNRWKSKYF